MGFGILLDGYILKVLEKSEVPLTRNEIKKRVEKEIGTKISWGIVDRHIKKLIIMKKVEDLYPEKKIKLYRKI